MHQKYARGGHTLTHIKTLHSFAIGSRWSTNNRTTPMVEVNNCSQALEAQLQVKAYET